MEAESTRQKPVERAAVLLRRAALLLGVFLVLIAAGAFVSPPLPHSTPSFLLSDSEAASQVLPPEFLPVDHWAYEELKKIWVAGATDSLFPSTRPVSRYDVAALLISLEKREDFPPGWAPVERLRREFAREIRALGGEPGYSTTPFIAQKKAEGLDLRFSLYASGDAALEREKDAYWRDGSRVGVQAWAVVSPNFVVFEDIYAGKITDGWRYGEELFSIKDFLIFSDRFYVSARTRLFEAQVGRDRLRWGPGSTGTLLLSDSAPTYTLFYVGKTFGSKVKLSTVSAILDSEEGKYLAGHRIEVAPARWVNLGLSETAVYHARGIEPMYAVSLIPFTLVERLLHKDAQSESLEDPQRNNVLVSADLAVRPARGLAFYGELTLDDLSEETSERPTRLAYQLGTSLSKPVGRRNVNLLAEVSRVWNYTYSVEYSTYFDRDHSHQGMPLGYYLGPDSRRISTVLSCDLSLSLECGLTWDEILRGEGALGIPWSEELGQVDAAEMSGIVEKERTLGVFLKWLPWDNVATELSGGLRDISDKDHVEGEEESFGFFSLRLTARW
jgi:hypothetical protein